MRVDLLALGGDLVNFPSQESIDLLYSELLRLPKDRSEWRFVNFGGLFFGVKMVVFLLVFFSTRVISRGWSGKSSIVLSCFSLLLAFEQLSNLGLAVCWAELAGWRCPSFSPLEIMIGILKDTTSLAGRKSQAKEVTLKDYLSLNKLNMLISLSSFWPTIRWFFYGGAKTIHVEEDSERSNPKGAPPNLPQLLDSFLLLKDLPSSGRVEPAMFEISRGLGEDLWCTDVAKWEGSSQKAIRGSCQLRSTFFKLGLAHGTVIGFGVASGGCCSFCLFLRVFLSMISVFRFAFILVAAFPQMALAMRFLLHKRVRRGLPRSPCKDL